MRGPSLRQRLSDAARPMPQDYTGEADIEMRGDTLCCPCGEENTHQIGIRVCFSQYEDSDKVRTAYADRKTTETREEFRTPDVGRRDAVFIHITCEHCDRLSVLRIQQHKGRTLLQWVKNTHPWAPWENPPPPPPEPETPEQRKERLIEAARGHRDGGLFSELDFDSPEEKREAYALLKASEEER